VVRVLGFLGSVVLPLGGDCGTRLRLRLLRLSPAQLLLVSRAWMKGVFHHG